MGYVATITHGSEIVWAVALTAEGVIAASIVRRLCIVVSMLAVGLPNSFFIAMTVLELALPAVYSFLMFRVAAQEARGTRSGAALMSREAALYQALAACGAALVAFIGVCHEAVGHIPFPWGPAFLGGPIGWHAAGIFTITAGLLVLAGT